jgi:hypothetical protein
MAIRGGRFSANTHMNCGRRPVILLTFVALACASLARGQDERRTRVPVLGKISGGPSRQAFSGKVQSLDLKRMILRVDTVEGGATEIFPVKKGLPVALADGTKMKLDELAVGATVLIYYEQKTDRRSVTEIVVLKGAADKHDKKAPPPS